MERLTFKSIVGFLLVLFSITILMPSSVMAITGFNPPTTASTWSQSSAGVAVSEDNVYNATVSVIVQEPKIALPTVVNQTIVCTLGCLLNETCIVQGSRVQTGTSISYCDIDSNWKEQKAVGEACLNNYECETNFCSSNSCYDVESQVKETNQLMEWIMNLLKSLFGNKLFSTP